MLCSSVGQKNQVTLEKGLSYKTCMKAAWQLNFHSMQCCSHKLSGGQRVKLLGLLLPNINSREVDANNPQKNSQQQMWNCKPATICGVWTDASRSERKDSFHGEKCKTKQKSLKHFLFQFHFTQKVSNKCKSFLIVVGITHHY